MAAVITAIISPGMPPYAVPAGSDLAAGEGAPGLFWAFLRLLKPAIDKIRLKSIKTANAEIIIIKVFSSMNMVYSNKFLSVQICRGIYMFFVESRPSA
jgi:hypothetical protein